MADFQPTGIGDWKTVFDSGKSDEWIKKYDAQYQQWLAAGNKPTYSVPALSGGLYQPSTPPGPGTVPSLGGTIDTVYQQPGLPTYGPGGTVPGGYKPPTMPTQNQGTSPFQNTQYNPLTPYNFMSIGGQGSMNQFNPFQNNDPAGGTMMNQSQGFYKSLPNYGFYQ